MDTITEVFQDLSVSKRQILGGNITVVTVHNAGQDLTAFDAHGVSEDILADEELLLGYVLDKYEDTLVDMALNRTINYTPYSMTLKYPNGFLGEVDLSTIEDVRRYLPDSIRIVGAENVFIQRYGYNVSLQSCLLDSVEDIVADRYPDLDYSHSGNDLFLYRNNDAILRVDVPESLVELLEKDDREKILSYIKEVYDDSLVDVYFTDNILN